MQKINFNKKNIVITGVVCLVLVGGFFLFSFINSNKRVIMVKSLQALDKVSGLLLIEEDSQKEISVLNRLVEEFTKNDGQTRTLMVLLQNNMELRPGGGFLGQYAVLKIKNGEVVSTFVEDSNLLDQRITTKTPSPYPFKKMMGTKNWKFRDSNFSPDFPTNVDKAKYFLRLSGRASNFDGVIAVNATVLNDLLELTGPITVPGYPGTYDSSNAFLKLEEQVEKVYLMNEDLDTQNRKAIMKAMAPIIIDKLFTLGNVTKIAELGHKEMRNKNVMLNFTNPDLQALVGGVNWDGKVASDWGGDYLMMSDANMGALKTDYYMRREISYDVDLTAEKPIVTLTMLYKNTATYGDWRTSDYHSYLRVYVPEGSKLVDRKMVSYPNIGTELGKTFFGFTLHALIGGQTEAIVKYELPENIDRENYKLLIQKQSGVGDVPVKVHVKTSKTESNQEAILTKDLKFEVK